MVRLSAVSILRCYEVIMKRVVAGKPRRESYLKLFVGKLGCFLFELARRSPKFKHHTLRQAIL